MWLQVVLLALGLALLIKGGEIFVSAAVRIAGFLRMPRVVIGSTLVSLATTTPELMVSIMAGATGEANLAVGNAVGSCICNIGLILGLTAALKHVDVQLGSLRRPLGAMFGFGVLLLLLSLDLHISHWQGLLLIAGGLAYFSYDFVQNARQREPEKVAEARAIAEDVGQAPQRLARFHSRRGSFVQFFAGAVVVIAGSRLLVSSAVQVAGALGIPSILIGLTVVAVGTSLPELITAVSSSRQNASDLAVGNILGANIANLTFILGTAAVLSEVSFSRPAQLYNFLALLALFGLLLWMMLTDRRITRSEGVTLIVFYVFYVSGLVLLAAALKS
jgi:cation:H+ antiporter